MSAEEMEELIVAQTVNWLESVVVRQNFCPFAESVMQRGSVRYSVCAEADPALGLEQLIMECRRLDGDRSIETTLLVLPSGFEDFEDFLDLLETGEALLQDQEYEGIYQLASFHPEYRFADAPVEDPANYTNRSPYPMLHLLREDGLEQALKNYPDPESIPRRNIDRARQIGIEGMKELLAACYRDRK